MDAVFVSTSVEHESIGSETRGNFLCFGKWMLLKISLSSVLSGETASIPSFSVQRKRRTLCSEAISRKSVCCWRHRSDPREKNVLVHFSCLASPSRENKRSKSSFSLSQAIRQESHQGVFIAIGVKQRADLGTKGREIRGVLFASCGELVRLLWNPPTLNCETKVGGQRRTAHHGESTLLSDYV